MYTVSNTLSIYKWYICGDTYHEVEIVLPHWIQKDWKIKWHAKSTPVFLPLNLEVFMQQCCQRDCTHSKFVIILDTTLIES
jgi:hypothetical protein